MKRFIVYRLLFMVVGLSFIVYGSLFSQLTIDHTPLTITTVYAQPAPAVQDCQPGDQRVDCVFGEIPAPSAIQPLVSRGGSGGLSLFFSNLISIIYAFAGVVFIFMVVIGAFQWIVSGGDKEAVAKARNRITHAIIGIVLLALSFLIISTIGRLTGFEFFKDQGFFGIFVRNNIAPGNFSTSPCPPNMAC